MPLTLDDVLAKYQSQIIARERVLSYPTVFEKESWFVEFSSLKVESTEDEIDINAAIRNALNATLRASNETKLGWEWLSKGVIPRFEIEHEAENITTWTNAVSTLKWTTRTSELYDSDISVTHVGFDSWRNAKIFEYGRQVTYLLLKRHVISLWDRTHASHFNPKLAFREVQIIENNLPVSEKELDWVEENFGELREKYGGQWIAVIGDSVMTHGNELLDLQIDLEKYPGVNPFLTWIPPQDEEPPILAV